MVFKLVFLTVLVQVVVLAPKTTPVPARVKVCSVLNFELFAHLIVDYLPIFALDPIIDLLIVVPIDVFVLALSFFGDSLKVFECVTHAILMERLPLCQFLQDLESCWQATVAIHIETQLRLEACWRNDLDTPVLVHFFVVVQVLDVIHWAFEFFLGGSEHWHLIDLLQFVVYVFRFDERIL